MANSLFLDTNGWLALLHAGDAMHRQAEDVWRDLIRRGYHVVLTDWIIAETGNGAARSPK
jgi:predicted nucleic acid-binding protein